MLNTESFTQKAKQIHGDLYDYSMANYRSRTHTIQIICKNHGSFFQLPGNHLKGSGCKKCARLVISENQRGSTESFIQKATQIHGDLYDYSMANYINNHTKIIIICSIHGQFLQTPTNHIIGKRNCPVCAKKHRKDTNNKKYGTDYPIQNKEIKEKTKQTNLTRYGVENPQQNQEIRNKTNQTNLDKYGVENPQQNQEIRNKTKQTFLLKYGGHPTTCIDTISKRICTNIKKYGVNHYNQYHMIDVLPLLENFDWIYYQYITLNKTCTQLALELEVDTTTITKYLTNHKISIVYNRNFSYKCICWLEYMMKTNNIYIQHALNEGEFLLSTKLKADGYCKETNTIYEFHGDRWHGNPELYKPEELCHPKNKNITAGELYQKTKRKEELIKSMGYNLIVMWENEFVL